MCLCAALKIFGLATYQQYPIVCIRSKKCTDPAHCLTSINPQLVDYRALRELYLQAVIIHIQLIYAYVHDKNTLDTNNSLSIYLLNLN